MNEEKKVPFKWEYGEETISLQLGMYANNQRLYIGMITHTEDGAEAFADMTVNLPGYSLDPGEAFISGDISKDLLRFIKENKLGKVLPYQVQSGYGKYSAVAFDLEKLKAFPFPRCSFPYHSAAGTTAIAASDCRVGVPPERDRARAACPGGVFRRYQCHAERSGGDLSGHQGN